MLTLVHQVQFQILKVNVSAQVAFISTHPPKLVQNPLLAHHPQLGMHQPYNVPAIPQVNTCLTASVPPALLYQCTPQPNNNVYATLDISTSVGSALCVTLELALLALIVSAN